MIGSSSIGPLSRATGDEQLLKTQRAGDNKQKQKEREGKNKKRDGDGDDSARGTEAVVVDIEFSDAVAQAVEDNGQPEGGAVQKHSTKNAEPEPVRDEHSKPQKQSSVERQGHIDVTG